MICLSFSASGCGRRDRPQHEGKDRKEKPSPAKNAAGLNVKKDSRPDIVLITIDTLRADAVGCYGSRRNTTPNIDALAKNGIVFENVVAQSSWTLPSVASFLTSRYPTEIAMKHIFSRFPAPVTTAAQIFSKAGYKTAAFVAGPFTDQRRAFDRGFGTFERFLNKARADKVNAAAGKWLIKPHPEPFFLWIHYFDVHADYDPPEPFDRHFGDAPGNPPQATVEQLAMGMIGKQKFTKEDLRAVRLAYDQEVAWVDSMLGRVVELLKKMGRYTDTAFIIGSDHGEGFYEHGLTLHLVSLYDELLRVPLIIHYPAGIKGGRRMKSQQQNLDILPTMLDIAGISYDGQMRGRSLLEVIKGDADENRSAFAHTAMKSHFPEYSRRLPGLSPAMFQTMYMLNNGREKLIYYSERNEYMQFDMLKDPGEKNNVYKPGWKMSGELSRELSKWIKDMKSMEPPGERISLKREVIEKLRKLGYVF